MNLFGIGAPEDEAEAMKRKIMEAGVTDEDFAAAENSKASGGLFSPALQAPKSPGERARENYGGLELFGRQLGARFLGGIFKDQALPEYSDANKAKYKSDLALYTKAREMDLVDPQDEAVATAIANGVTGTELMALQARAAGVDPLSLDQATLSPGQIRFDAFGNQIASGGDPVSTPGSIERRATAFAEGYGIQPGTRAYADIVAAMSEPTHTETLPDGTQRTYNTIDAVRANILGGAYAGMGGPSAEAGGTAATASVPGISPEDIRLANLREQADKWDNERQGEFKEKNEFYTRLQGQMDKMGTYDSEKGTFTANDAVRDIYGSVDSKFPDWARGDDERMAQALVDQVVEILAVDERGKLKGQGQITEGETKMLRDSLTVLTNMGIGDKDMEAEIARLYKNVLGLSSDAANFRSRNPYRKQIEARADGMPAGFEVD